MKQKKFKIKGNTLFVYKAPKANFKPIGDTTPTTTTITSTTAC